MKNVAYALALTLYCLPSIASAETLKNSDIVELTKVGLGDEALIAKINESPTQFDVSTSKLIELRNAGVTSTVIAAMIGAAKYSTVSANAAALIDSPDPKAPHPSGIYMLRDWTESKRMLVLDPTTSNQTKSGGFLAYALTGGLASMNFKTVVPNAHARVTSSRTRPTFYFYFDQTSRSLSGGATNTFWAAGTVTSPNEFSLVKFKVKDDRREAKVGSFNIGGAKSGVMDEDRIPFGYSIIAPGVYEVRPDLDLKPGEYGFLYSATTGGGVGLAGVGAMTSRIFDFSISTPE